MLVQFVVLQDAKIPLAKLRSAGDVALRRAKLPRLRLERRGVDLPVGGMVVRCRYGLTSYIIWPYRQPYAGDTDIDREASADLQDRSCRPSPQHPVNDAAAGARGRQIEHGIRIQRVAHVSIRVRTVAREIPGVHEPQQDVRLVV